MDEPQLPVKTGQSADADPAPPDCPVAKYYRTFAEISQEHVLFTPAIIQIFTALDRDVVASYVDACKVPDGERPLTIDCAYPVFSRLPSNGAGPTVNWNHRLYVVHKSRWDELREFVCRIVVCNPQLNMYAEIGWHELRIVDTLALKGDKVLSELPFVTIYSFALNSNVGLIIMEESRDPPRTLPRPRRGATDPAILATSVVALGPLVQGQKTT